ncbi:MAG: DJ-1/PfpI family protein [Oligoflexia bacterium]|nr:DJ-1/PfpI family protein [Oligoflexia bacterium]
MKVLKVLMVIASSQFRDEEYKQPREVFEGAGYDVIVASSTLKKATGVLVMEVTPDVVLADVRIEEYVALVFVGGAGAQEFFDDQQAHKLVRQALDAGMVVAAICIAPTILANAGILEGIRATVYPAEGEIKNFQDKKAIYTKRDVEVAGKIITANGPKAAHAFGESIVKVLSVSKGAE